MSSSRCYVCGNALPTNYRGRPRKTCSNECQTKRRVIRRGNRNRKEQAEFAVLEALHCLTPWPELRENATNLLVSLKELSDEVVVYNVERGTLQAESRGLGNAQEAT